MPSGRAVDSSLGDLYSSSGYAIDLLCHLGGGCVGRSHLFLPYFPGFVKPDNDTDGLSFRFTSDYYGRI